MGERMVAEAEKYKEEDEEIKDTIVAKNALESYAYNMKSSVEDDKVKDKISEEDKQTILDRCKETLAWMDGNSSATKDEYEHQQKELEKVCSPIITKMYQAAGGDAGGMPGGGMPGGMGGAPPPSGGGGSGPTIE